MIVSPLVLAEVDHLAKVRFGTQARHAILDNIVTQALCMRFQVPEVSADALKLAREVQRKYADLTLDRRYFRAIRPLTPHKAFRVLPDDL